MRLADGRVAVVSGLAFPAAGVGPADVHAVLSGRALLFRSLSNQPDRWGRTRIRLFWRPAGGGEAARSDVGVDLVRRGLALFRPDPDAAGCRELLLEAERTARQSNSGLWTGFRVVDGGDRQAAVDAPQGFVLVEGEVASVGTAGGRVYLNLGKTRTVDLVIVILRPNIQHFEAGGVQLSKLAGRRIRARGLLDRRFGPQIEIATPDALEIVGRATEGEARGR